MRVTVHYLAQLKRAAGLSRETLEVPAGSTLLQVLTKLADRHDPHFRSMLLDDAGQPQRSLLFFVDDRSAALQQVLADRQEITILAPMAGG